MDSHLLAQFKTDSVSASYLIEFEQAPLDTTTVRPLDRPQYVFDTLTRWTQKTQAAVRKILDDEKITYNSYWITNVIAVQSNVSLALMLAARTDVVFMESNKQFRAVLEVPETIEDYNVTDTDALVPEWNVVWVKADQLWAKGITGTGYVVANADTGVAWRHPALTANYRGTNGATADHNYNWWDAIHGGGNNACGLNSQQPCDDNGHGTHTTGTACGAESTGIGVAPGAKWIACRNMNAGLGTPQTYIECLEFFAAPHDLQGENPDPSRAPHVIGNSYGCPPSEGCAAQALSSAVSHVVDAGIFMSVSAGNSGPSCRSVNDPPAIYAASYSIGATLRNSHNIASFSSRGAVDVDQSNRVKPDLVAPGSSVRSSYPPAGYASLSGTSMASPHITGAIPLLWQAKPALARDIAGSRTAFNEAAFPMPVTTCNSPSSSPNNVYGYGDLDVLAAAE